MSSYFTDADAGLESLADIEGYEFLSDLDAGFEEELKALGVDPSAPTAAKPGSEEKVMMLAARYAADDGDWKRARLLLENLIANGADRDVRVLSELAVVQLRSGDAKAAEDTGRQAYKIQRASPLASEVWGLSLATTGRRPYAARSLLGKAAQFFGDSPLIAEARRKLAKRRDG